MILSKLLKNSSAFLILTLLLAGGETFADEALKAKVRKAIIERTTLQMGSPYLFEGAGTNGYDCSGLVYSIYLPFFDYFPRTSSEMASVFPKCSYEELEPGDLIFFATGSDPERVTHVGIFAGNGEMIHSASAGSSTGVIRSSFVNETYWRKRYLYGVKIF